MSVDVKAHIKKSKSEGNRKFVTTRHLLAALNGENTARAMGGDRGPGLWAGQRSVSHVTLDGSQDISRDKNQMVPWRMMPQLPATFLPSARRFGRI